MLKKLLFIILLNSLADAYAQDDLLNMLNDEPEKAKPVYASFKSTRVINLHSNETMRAKHLDFRIQHRFGDIGINAANNYGFYNMFGVDGARIRLGLEYGITNDWMVGIGRSSEGKTYDAFVKYKLLKQTKGKNAMPLSVNYFGNIGVMTQEWPDKNRKNLETSRLSYVHQIILAKKFNDYFSMCLSPTLVHHNLVQTKKQPNDIYALGIGTSIKISRSTRFNVEYIPRLNGRDEPKDASGKPLYYDAFAIGFDIETGGHVFQLHFTNASGMIEQQFIAQNTGQFNLNQIRLGFNISRTFSFDHK